MNRVIIGLGSNISPLGNVRQALVLLMRSYPILKQSSWFWTQPAGVSQPQPVFINMGCLLVTLQSRADFTRRLKRVETILRRAPRSNHLPRTVDLDILVWNGRVVDKDVYERRFLRIIISQLMPQLRVHLARKRKNSYYGSEVRGVH